MTAKIIIQIIGLICIMLFSIMIGLKFPRTPANFFVYGMITAFNGMIFVVIIHLWVPVLTKP